MGVQTLYYFPVLAIPIVFLLYYSGPLSAVGLTVFATLVGTLAFIFSAGGIYASRDLGSIVVPVVILGHIAWFWALFWLAEILVEAQNEQTHQVLEEAEKLELRSLDFQHQQKEIQSHSRALKERISRYQQIRHFTNELAIMLKLNEVQEQVEIAVHRLFAGPHHTESRLTLFSQPDLPKDGDSLSDWMVKHRTPVLISDTYQDLRFPEYRFKKNLSIIASPIVREEQVAGILTVECEKPDHWTQEDLRFLSDISNIVSLALANAVYFDKVETLAVKDSLTGLFARYRFDERVEEEFSRAKAYGSTLSLVMFDLDHFKKVNDTWGHQYGDQVLQAVAKVIQSQTRETDFCARYGGEEIAVIMPLASLENAYQIADRIRKNVESSRIGEHKVQVTLSGGVTSVQSPMKDLEDLVHSVDQALYQAKEKGRNQVVKASS